MEIKYSKQATKFLDKQEESVELRIRKSIEKLPAGDVVKLKGTNDMYRLRIGDFRVIFYKEGNTIKVSKIDNRGQAYKD